MLGIYDITVVQTGGTGKEGWVDINICSCITNSGDNDNDLVCNSQDVCLGGDDKLDFDLDRIPDGCDTFPDDPENDSNDNGVSDVKECIKRALDSFEYPAGTQIGNNTEGGYGFNGGWSLDTQDNGLLEIETGSLSYLGLTTQGNKAKIAITNQNSTVSITRKFPKPFVSGNEFWVSLLVNANKIGNGGFWVKPKNRQVWAFGKRWGTEFSIDNTGTTGINMAENQTYWLVARYKLGAYADSVYYWINPNPNIKPALNTADSIITHPVPQQQVSEVSIAFERWGLPIYKFDEFRVTCGYPYPLNTCDLIYGKTCEDGDPCTIQEIYVDNCMCVGITLDTDGDSICDGEDPCRYSPTNDANGNYICDNLDCGFNAYELFDYPTGSNLNTQNGGAGFTTPWNDENTNAVTVGQGNLDHPVTANVGNKIVFTPSGTSMPMCSIMPVNK